MKKKYLLIIPILLVLLLTGCQETKTDAQRFAEGYAAGVVELFANGGKNTIDGVDIVFSHGEPPV